MIALPVGDAYVIELSGGGLGVTTQQTLVITRGRDRDGDYWTAEQAGENRKLEEVTRIDRSTDSRACPALSGVASDVPRIPKGAKPQMAFDVPSTSISVRHAGRLQPLAPLDYVGPIARWGWRILTEIEPCWPKTAP